jgi:selenocysteine-specific elongation factor
VTGCCCAIPARRPITPRAGRSSARPCSTSPRRDCAAADAPFSAPEADRLRELGLDARGAAAAERAGLLRRLPGNLLLAPDAGDQAARILATLPQPFTAADARQALKTTRRVVIPLLEWLDREGITRRLPDNRRTMREPPRHRGGNGGR